MKSFNEPVLYKPVLLYFHFDFFFFLRALHHPEVTFFNLLPRWTSYRSFNGIWEAGRRLVWRLQRSSCFMAPVRHTGDKETYEKLFLLQEGALWA